MLQTFNFSAPQNVLQWQVEGRFFLYQSSNAAALGIDPTISLYAEGQSLGDFKPGDRLTLPRNVKEWRIETASPLLAGRLKIGEGRVETAEMSGAVEVIDGQVNRVMTGKCYWSSTLRNGSATNYAAVGIYNASVDKLLAINTAKLVVGAACQLRILTGGPLVNQTSDAGLRNKKLGDPSSPYFRGQAGHCLNYPPVAPADFAIAPTFMGQMAFPNKGETLLTFSNDGPLILASGVGLWFVANVVNSALDLVLETDATEL